MLIPLGWVRGRRTLVGDWGGDIDLRWCLGKQDWSR